MTLWKIGRTDVPNFSVTCPEHDVKGWMDYILSLHAVPTYRLLEESSNETSAR